MLKKLRMKAILGACTALFAAASVQAAIVSSTGNVEVLTGAPASVVEGQLADADKLRAFNEKQGFVLQQSLLVDYVSPLYTSAGFIAAGTVVDSHFLNFDVPANRPRTTRSGTVTFDGLILGLIFSNNYLDLSDPILGAVGTTYPTGVERRFFNETGDLFTVTGGQLTFNFTSRVNNNGIDQMRIVTASAAQPIPEPGTLALFGLAMVGLVGTARLKRRS